jgi:UDP-N-acetyl-2-amino-2-deoxyglucuronate dehydrogenase
MTEETAVTEFAPRNFAVLGVAGYIAPRHLRAIRDTGQRLVAAADPRDSVGTLDQFGYDVRFFTEIERFDRHLEKLRRGPATGRVHMVSICSPNYLHDAHCRLALRAGADALCEKPLVINPWNLDALAELEQETGRRVYTVLQLRLHPALQELRRRLALEPTDRQHEVEMTYVTARGAWYHVSWKGQEEKSGGVVTNIGIHLFDLLLWLFGPAGAVVVHHADPQRVAGFLELQRARVRYYLSVCPGDVPAAAADHHHSSYRSICVDGQTIEFTEGFTELHTRVYQETLAGRGFGIAEARPSVALTHRIRTTRPTPPDGQAHPILGSRRPVGDGS